MQNFLESLGIIIVQLLTGLGSVAISLLSNEIFQILVAIIIFLLLIYLILVMLEYRTGWATKLYYKRKH